MVPEDGEGNTSRARVGGGPSWRDQYDYGATGMPREEAGAARPGGWTPRAESWDTSGVGPESAIERAIIMLADCQSRPPAPRPVAPEWPKFNDTYRTYAKFSRELTSYLDDYCRSLSERSIVISIKKHCFSPQALAMIERYGSVQDIL